jgi:hypothetical protein
MLSAARIGNSFVDFSEKGGLKAAHLKECKGRGRKTATTLPRSKKDASHHSPALQEGRDMPATDPATPIRGHAVRPGIAIGPTCRMGRTRIG